MSEHFNEVDYYLWRKEEEALEEKQDIVDKAFEAELAAEFKEELVDQALKDITEGFSYTDDPRVFFEFHTRREFTFACPWICVKCPWYIERQKFNKTTEEHTIELHCIWHKKAIVGIGRCFNFKFGEDK